MTPVEGRLAHVGMVLAAGSGLLLGTMKYLMSPVDPDSPLNHPAQPWVQKAHVVAVPLVIFALGAIWRSHGLARFRHGVPVGRRSGRVILFVSLPVVVSGVLAQVVTHEAARRWTGWAHAALGLAFALAWLFHPRRDAAAVAARDPDDSGG